MQDQGSRFCGSSPLAALLGLGETLSELSLAEELCRTWPWVMCVVRLIGTPKLAVPAAARSLSLCWDTWPCLFALP